MRQVNLVNNKVIGFDIDDTLTDGDDYCDSMLEEFLTMRNLPPYRGPIRSDRYALEERYPGLNSRIIKDFNNFWFPRKVNNVPVREGTKELLEELKRLDYRIHIITRRDKNYDKSPYKGSMMVEHTLGWFNRNKLPYDKITFSCFDKLKTCKEQNVKILFEDSPSNILRVSKEVPVIIPIHEYNKYMIGTNMYVVDSLYPDKVVPLVEKLTLL